MTRDHPPIWTYGPESSSLRKYDRPDFDGPSGRRTPPGGRVGRSLVRGIILSLVECRAPARRPKYDGQTCGGFVMQAPVPVRVAGIIPHSERARRGAWVGRCSSCGAVHEVMPEEALEEA